MDDPVDKIAKETLLFSIESLQYKVSELERELEKLKVQVRLQGLPHRSPFFVDRGPTSELKHSSILGSKIEE